MLIPELCTITGQKIVRLWYRRNCDNLNKKPQIVYLNLFYALVIYLLYIYMNRNPLPTT